MKTSQTESHFVYFHILFVLKKNKVAKIHLYFKTFLIKQLFHQRLLDMIIVNSALQSPSTIYHLTYIQRALVELLLDG